MYENIAIEAGPVSDAATWQPDYIEIPEDFDLEEYSKINRERILVVAPYCLKSIQCPGGRFSEHCLLSCEKCCISDLASYCKLQGIKLRVETEGKSSFMDYLEEHHKEFDLLIAFACDYTANKIGHAVNKIFGIRGVVIPLKGNVCACERKYVNGIKQKKTDQTATDMITFFRILQILKSSRLSAENTRQSTTPIVTEIQVPRSAARSGFQEKRSITAGSESLTRARDSVVYSGLFISLGAVLTTYMSAMLSNVRFDLGLFSIAFLNTFSIYNFNRKTDEKEDSISHPRRFTYFAKHARYLFVGVVISYLLAVAISMTRNFETTIILVVPLILVIFYGANWIPSSLSGPRKLHRLKQIPIVKDLLVAFGWSLIPFLVASYWSFPISLTTWLTALFIFGRIFIGAVVFDIRDTVGDKATGITTLPLLIGTKRTILSLAFVNSLSAVLFFYATFQGLLPQFMNWINVGVTLYGYVFLYLAATRFDKKLLCDVIVDGEYILLGLLALGAVSFR